MENVDEEDDDGENEDHEEEEEEVVEAVIGEAVDAGVAGEVFGEGGVKVTRALKCPLVSWLFILFLLLLLVAVPSRLH